LEYERDFFGREKEIEALLGYIGNTECKAVWIWGESGIGKSRLAKKVVDDELPEDVVPKKQRYRELAYRPANTDETGEWRSGNVVWLITSLAHSMSANPPSKGMEEEYVECILAEANARPVVVLLDNAETLESDWLENFVVSWLEKVDAPGAGSTLLLTTTVDPKSTKIFKDPRCAQMKLAGLDPASALEILGDIYKDPNHNYSEKDRKQAKDTLGKAAKTLKYSPRQLEFLRFLAPKEAEFKSVANKLNDEKQQADIIAKKLDEINEPTAHFMALSKIRTNHFDEDLFQWLWDRLCGENAASYARVRNLLIENKLLSVDNAKGSLELHPRVHMILEGILQKKLGLSNTVHVDYFLSEYYRRAFLESSKQPDAGLSDLYNYLFHAHRGKNFPRALAFINDPEFIQLFHHKGLAFALHFTLDLVEKQIEKDIEDEERKLRDAEETKSGEITANVATLRGYLYPLKIEIAHCKNDLSEHKECLDYLDEALTIRGHLDNFVIDEAQLQTVYYLRGVSFSDLGQSYNCIEAYRKAVACRADDEKAKVRRVLSMGYLAMECRFTNLKEAELQGKEALKLAQERDNPALVSKNSCSLAHTYLAQNRLEKAFNLLDEAANLCEEEHPTGEPDKRELGRVLLNRAMLHMAYGRKKKADEDLRSAEKIHKSTKDRRRINTGKTLRALWMWKFERNGEEGIKILEETIKDRVDMNDRRNLIFDSLCYAYMQGYKNSKAAIAAAEIHAAEKTHADATAEQEVDWSTGLVDVPKEVDLDAICNHWDLVYPKHLLTSP
jgi:hypothetical protein